MNVAASLDQALSTTCTENRVRVPAVDVIERTIELPEFVDGDGIAAEFNNGPLTVRVPKAKAAQARRIEVKN